MRTLARRSARWWRRSGGRRLDLVFMDVEDRDSGLDRVSNGDRETGWDADDFPRNTAYVRAFHRRTRQPVVIWQIPVGNSTLPDEWGAFRDTHVEWWLGSRDRLARERDAGVVALLCDGGADGTTSPQSDGGLLFRLARRYDEEGTLALRRR